MGFRHRRSAATFRLPLTLYRPLPTETSIPCRVEAPPAFVPKARYALAELLAPLGLRPDWVAREEAGAGSLYYGPPESAPPGVLSLPLHPDTAAYFTSGAAYDPDDAWEAGGVPVLFPRGRVRAEAGAQHEPDLIASAFFWLSGWQEATVAERDVHGRFPYAASLQAALGCVEVPMVDRYRERLAERLRAHGVPVRRPTWGGRSWAVALTHDVDLLRKRRLGTLGRALGRSDGRRAAALRQALTGPDPRRDSLRRLAAVEHAFGVAATYFLMTAARGAWDVPYGRHSGFLSGFVRDVQAAGSEVGLHPSYFAHDHLGHLAEERDRLEALTGQPPTTVRQHFLRFDPVRTPRLQQAAGFRLDSSLGFSQAAGFRRGTAFPFQLYDLAADRPLDLWELPLHVMDTTLFTHQQLSPEAAEAALDRIWTACRRVGGCAVLLWHNTLYDEVDYPGQAAVFERGLRRALDGGAFVGSLRQVWERRGWTG